MNRWMTTVLPVAVVVMLAVAVPMGHAETAEEILDKAMKENLRESFRVSLQVKTFKGSKQLAAKSIWLMGRIEPQPAAFFLDFEEPADTKGLRFLVLAPMGQDAKAFMYLPATKRTLPLATDDPSVDLGGTGLTMEDIQVFVPYRQDQVALLKEEKFKDRDCYVIKVTRAEGKGERLAWITKQGYQVIKSQNLNAQGKVERSFQVVEFFKTESGKEFPREEEILIPSRDMRIMVRQENAVFGVEIPENIINPETFGSFKWKDL
jgi:hypothetical protein